MTCKICNGTGKVVHHEPPSSDVRDIGNGMTMQCMGGMFTRACACVRDLPPIDGAATWWDMEPVFGGVVAVPVGGEAIEVSVRVEVPRNDAGRRLHRTAENFYYPTLIEMEGPETVTFFPATARELSRVLLAAADACEKADTLPKP